LQLRHAPVAGKSPNLSDAIERIARIAAPADHALTTRRDACWAHSLRQYGLTEDARLSVNAYVTTHGGCHAAIQFLGHDSPDGVVVDSPSIRSPREL